MVIWFDWLKLGMFQKNGCLSLLWWEHGVWRDAWGKKLMLKVPLLHASALVLAVEAITRICLYMAVHTQGLILNFKFGPNYYSLHPNYFIMFQEFNILKIVMWLWYLYFSSESHGNMHMIKGRLYLKERLKFFKMTNTLEHFKMKNITPSTEQKEK